MQCPSCRAVYSNGLDTCPRCKTPASKPIIADTEATVDEVKTLAPTPTQHEAVNAKATPSAKSGRQATSTLIEFPGTARASRPQWRKDLSARVREIQERRARESEERPLRPIEEPITITIDTAAPPLGLVPPTNSRVVNPIVAAALKRLERAQQPSPRSHAHASIGGGAAATAVARVAEEHYETEPARKQEAETPLPSSKPTKREQTVDVKSSEPARAHQLAVVARTAPTKKPPQPISDDSPKLRQSAGVTAQALIEAAPTVAESLPVEEVYDDHAPIFSRIAGGLLDLLVVAFASSPFAAIIELTNGNWGDWRVIASMSGVVLVVMFLYHTASTALAGRTWGMSLVSLRAVDADTGLPPTTKQAVGRALLYILSLITLGFGLAYALIDAEARTLPDYLSGTAVVRE